MKDFGKKVLKYVIITILTFITTVIFTNYFKEKTFGFKIKYATSSLTYAIVFFVVVSLLIYDLLRFADGKGKKKSDKAVDKVKDSKGKDASQYFDKDFVDEEDLKKNKAFGYHNINTIRTCKKDGILVRAEEKGNNMDINIVQPIHALVVGTTSSGKTTRYVVPTFKFLVWQQPNLHLL